MIVSWNWLKEYVALGMSVEQLEQRLIMAGLNHEGTETVADDIAIDLEVTSNRPDCLGHIGVAREIAVLYQTDLRVPAAQPEEGPTPVETLSRVTLDCPELCSRYTARVIQGVQVGTSPDWMVARLKTLGIAAINNIVDITNYVLMESGQPLHAFDLARLAGPEIIVRAARAGEPFEAINHKTFELEKGMCVIADAERPVALGGVMGGADSEVSEATTDLLIESALFDPISIRTTARRLTLHSDSSYRFERGPDPLGVDWASRRCCELILELAGGQLAAGVLDVGRPPPPRTAIVLRLRQLQRILGIDVPAEEVRRILQALGNCENRADATAVEVIPPSWRADLAREIDLVEEVARIHGYDRIPEDAKVPMAASARTDEDRVLEKVRRALTAAGFDEAMTASVVDENISEAFSPWSDAVPLVCEPALLRGANRLRRSLVPSLLAARRINESLANPVIELFEIAKVYLPTKEGLPTEEKMIALASGQDYFAVKGTLEMMLASLNRTATFEVVPYSDPLLQPGRCGQLQLGGRLLGFIGQVSAEGLQRFDLRAPTTVAEVMVDVLLSHSDLVPRYAETSPYPAVHRDLNFEVAESVSWAELSATAESSAGPYLEALRHVETYRDAQRLGADRKSLVLKVVLRKPDGTLTGEEADRVRAVIEKACRERHDARLRA